MAIYEINPLQDPRWGALLESHPQASVFHTTEWLQSLKNAYGYEPLAVSTCAPGIALTNGLLFCRVESWLTGRRFVSLPFSDHCDPLVEDQQRMDELLGHMRKMVDVSTWKYLEIRPTVLSPAAEADYVRDAAYCLHRLDLRKSKEELFRGFHKDCVQRKIRRAERESLIYQEGNSEELLTNFYHLLVRTRRGQGLPPQPLLWFRSLIAAFGDALKIRVACKGKVPVASILTLTHRQSMTYKYGCSDPEHNRLGGVALLFWKTIQEAKQNEYTDLDLGRSDVNNSGLVAFKEHWGATRYPLSYWRYPMQPRSLRIPLKAGFVERIFSRSPGWLLRSVGTFLYRHIG